MKSCVWLIAAGLIAAAVAPVEAARPERKSKVKVSKELKGIRGDQDVEVLVRYQSSPTDDDARRVTGRGGIERGRFGSINAAHHTIKGRDLGDLENDPRVEAIAPVRSLGAHMDLTSPTVGAGTVNVSGYTGAGIGVAVIDSGVNPSVDLRVAGSTTSRIVYSQDFTGSGTTADQFGHGTHVAGIIAGNGASSSTGAKKSIKGVAPAAHIVNLKVLDKNGKGDDAKVVAAIDRAIALKSTYNIRVINLSLGRAVFDTTYNDPLCWAVERAYYAGIAVVASAGNQGRNNSAGNQGYGMIASPGNDPYVITVGATRTVLTTSRADDTVTTYSSKGPTLFDQFLKPDILAPGNVVASLRATGGYLDTTYPLTIVPTSYYLTAGTSAAGVYSWLSGTSMATPVVSGTVALMLQKSASLSPDIVKARLMKTASKTLAAAPLNIYNLTTFTISNDAFTIGAGYLDANAAINNTDTATGEAYSAPTYWDAASKSVKLTVVAGLDIWAQPVFTPTYVWGTSTMLNSTTLWKPSTAPWGNSSSSA